MSKIETIITEGFPRGWYIQERPSDETALLCVKSDVWFFSGDRCVALRPRYMTTADWLPMARRMAVAITPDRDERAAALEALSDHLGEAVNISSTFTPKGEDITIRFEKYEAKSAAGPFNAVKHHATKEAKP